MMSSAFTMHCLALLLISVLTLFNPILSNQVLSDPILSDPILSDPIPSKTIFPRETVQPHFEISLLPTVHDFNLRSYYQGVIQTKECAFGCDWSLEISAVGLGPKQNVKDYLSIYSGSLTSWSAFFNADQSCFNSVSPTGNGGIFYTCNKRTTEGTTFFGGSFKWNNKYTTNIFKQLNFTLILDYHTQSPQVVTTKIIDIDHVEEGGIISYSNLDRIGTSKLKFDLNTAFKASQPINSFALRPFGSMAWKPLENLVCTMNGIQTSTVYRYSSISDATPDPIFDAMSYSYLFSLQPTKSSPYVPYSHLTNPNQAYSFASGALITIKCTFEVPYYFYTSDFPFGVGYQFGNFATDAAFDQTQTERIQQLLQGGSMVFVPRPVASATTSMLKSLLPQSVYYSGVMPLYSSKGRLTSSLAQMTAVFTLDLPEFIDDDALFRCKDPNASQINTNAFRLLLAIDQDDMFVVNSVRYALIGQNKDGFGDHSLMRNYILQKNKKTSQQRLLFEGIDFCSILDHADFDITQPLKIIIQVGANFSPKRAEDAEPYQKTHSEYSTPLFSPLPINMNLILKTINLDQEQHTTQNYQSTSISWSSNYQMKATQYPVVDMPIKRTTPTKNENKIYRENFSFEINIQPLEIQFELLFFHFPTGNFIFFGDFTKTCSLYQSNSNFEPDEHSRISLLPYNINYSIPDSGIVIHTPDFKTDTHYVLRCSELHLQNGIVWEDHAKTATHSSLGLHGIPHLRELREFLVSGENSKEMLIAKVLAAYLPDYILSSKVPVEPVFVSPGNTVQSVTHYSQVAVDFPKAPTSPLWIVLGVLLFIAIATGIGVGIWCWRKRQNETRKSALMEYYNYNDSVKEYL